ncbi:uncharacterized protein LOC121837031 [Ixodes scapularis]|uniref:uncharacterized protein LOC121837031 n=1 Tax=Ixodes scapularis TaxID=6945 RepID=UPI001C37F6F2|nr:uncharacterized protein LOC121837031 [Ixodes scapularis]
MNTLGLPSLAPFLEAPGDPAVPWRQWREDFEIFLQATEMDAKPPAQRKAILLQCLGVEGRRVFRTLVPEPAAAPAPPITAAATGSAPEKTTSKRGEPDDYTDALRLLERHFTNTLNVLVERRRFMLRRQRQEEPIRAYVSALRQLASTCDFGDFLEAALRDKVVDGVRSVELRQKLLMKGSQLTLGQAMDILQTFEQAAEGARVYEEGRDAAMVQQVERARNRSGTGVSGSSTVPDRRCYRCGASGHLASARECRARDKRCSRCHKVGHFQAVCRSTGQARVQAVQDTDGNEELGVLTVTQNERTTLIVDVCVEGEVIQLVVDTGSSVSILPANIYQEKFARRFALAPATVTLRDFSQQRIPVLGCFVAQAARGGVSSNIRFYVVSRGMALLGLDAVQQLRLHIDGASLACLQTTAGPQPLPPELKVVEPLRRFLRKGQEFIWDQNAEESFGKAKNLLASCSAVSMFDRSLPVQVTTDASAYGLGAVLQQVIDGETRTIAFASRTLTPQERKYSTGEREALACLWACEHWHVYLWGRNFVLRTDHQALVTLLSTNGTGRRPLRIERWCARLMRYNFTVQYTKGEDNVVADALSRLPLLSTECDPVEEVIAVVSSVVTKNQLQVETEKDGVLREVMQYVTSRWPEKKCLSGKLLSFWRIQEELSVLEGVLFRAERVVPPSTLVSRFIMMAHESHPGIVRTKQRLREQYWWPGMDEDVENCIRSCAVCKASDKSAKTAVAPLQPVQWPEKPWEKLGMDIVGPMERAPPECRFAVTVIDYHSKWPEVFFVSSITSQSVTKVLLELFAREGYPKSVVTDNGRQFMSTQFEGFLQDRGIEHCVASLYYPQCNGQIERFNRVLKEYIQVAALERRPLKEAILEYLSIYRATPHATTGMSPAFLLHGRRPRTRLDVVGLPERGFFDEPRPHVAELQRRVKERQQRTKNYTDERRGARHSIIEPGDFVKIKRWGGPKGQQRFSLPIEVKKRVGKNSFLLDNGKKWNAAKLTVVAKGGAPGARNLVEKVMERRGAVRDQLGDLDLPTEEGASQLPSPRDVATARTPETLSPGDDSATVATHGVGAARGAETLPDSTLQETEIWSTPAESAPAPEQVEAQDISGQQELLTTAPSYSRPQRQRRMPGKYNDYVLH